MDSKPVLNEFETNFQTFHKPAQNIFETSSKNVRNMFQMVKNMF